jgi:hypothetical protein
MPFTHCDSLDKYSIKNNYIHTSLPALSLTLGIILACLSNGCCFYFKTYQIVSKFILHCIRFLLFSSRAVSEEVDLYPYYKALQLKTWEHSFQNQELRYDVSHYSCINTQLYDVY